MDASTLGGFDPEEECGGISAICGGEYLVSEVQWSEVSSMIYNTNTVSTERLDTPIFVGVGIGTGKVILVDSNRRHGGGRHGYHKIPRRGRDKTESCPV